MVWGRDYHLQPAQAPSYTGVLSYYSSCLLWCTKDPNILSTFTFSVAVWVQQARAFSQELEAIEPGKPQKDSCLLGMPNSLARAWLPAALQ